MKSYPLSEVVLETLGDKVLEAIVGAVSATRADLSLYRQRLPDIVASHSPRGLANWIHDRLWHHLVTELEEQDNVRILDRGPTREIYINERYRVRVKRHSRKGAVASYPTQSATNTEDQPKTPPLDGTLPHGPLWSSWSNHNCSDLIAQPNIT